MAFVAPVYPFRSDHLAMAASVHGLACFEEESQLVRYSRSAFCISGHKSFSMKA